MVGKFTIFWTSFEPEYPDVVSETIFNKYKSSNLEKLVSYEFNFFEIFYRQLIIIFFGVVFILADTYHWYRAGGLMEILAVLVFIIAIIVLLSFIPSAISFFTSYFQSKEYVSMLNKALLNNDSYKTFCLAMSESDKRYIMHIQRISNNENL